MVSRIGNHVYVKGADEAIKVYKEAFGLVEKGEPWLDEEALIIHQDLVQKNGDMFLSLTEYKHLPNSRFIEKFSIENCPPMLFYVFFSSKDDLHKAFSVLSVNAILCRDLETEGNDIVCEIIDKFGVFWHFRLPENQTV